MLEVARQGTLGAAAAELFVAVPTLSEAVRRVESDLGVQLFVRTNRGMQLTEAGSALIDRLAAVADAETDLRAATQHDNARSLRIGCPQACWFATIRETGTMLDNVNATTINTSVFTPIQALFDGQADYALLPAPSDHDGVLQRRALFTEERTVNLSAGLVAPGQSRATLAELDEHQWMGRPPGADISYTSVHRCDDLRGGPPPRVGPFYADPIDIGTAMARGELVIAGTRSISNMFNLDEQGIGMLEIAPSLPWQVDLVALSSPKSPPAVGFDEVAEAMSAAVAASPLLTLL